MYDFTVLSKDLSFGKSYVIKETEDFLRMEGV